MQRVDYAMWGYFFETDPLSINDLIISTLGGANLGESVSLFLARPR